MARRRLVLVLLLSGLIVSAGPVALCFTKPGPPHVPRPRTHYSGLADDLYAPEAVGRFALALADLEWQITAILARSYYALWSVGHVGLLPGWVFRHVFSPAA